MAVKVSVIVTDPAVGEFTTVGNPKSPSSRPMTAVMAEGSGAV
ncbi:hypothetical protein ACFVH0_27315 [Streptomyces sp. NPDC127117]